MRYRRRIRSLLIMPFRSTANGDTASTAIDRGVVQNGMNSDLAWKSLFHLCTSIWRIGRVVNALSNFSFFSFHVDCRGPCRSGTMPIMLFLGVVRSLIVLRSVRIE